MNLNCTTPARRRSEGSAVIVVVAILALLLMFSTANRITLNLLSGELKLIDERQQRRIEQFESPGPRTNTTTIHPAQQDLSHGSD